MDLRVLLSVIGVVGWTLASAPVRAAGDPLLSLLDSEHNGQLTGTYTLEKYVQNGTSVTATIPFSGASSKMLLVGLPYVIARANIDDPTGQSTLEIRFELCRITSAGSSGGSSTSVHITLACGTVMNRVAPLPSPSPSPTPKPTAKPTPAPTVTPTPTAILPRPLALPTVKK